MPLRLLCITAHPDDESGAFGGVLLMAHRDGAETSLLCLTDGQAAHFRGGVENNGELGRKRREELAAACEVLGVTRHEVLHYPDGELPRQDFYQMVGEIVARIRTWRPQKLYYSTMPFISVRDHPELAETATVPYSLTLELGEFARRKRGAFAKHSSQAGVLERVKDHIAKAFITERYLLAAAKGQISVAEDKGIFEGVVPD